MVDLSKNPESPEPKKEKPDWVEFCFDLWEWATETKQNAIGAICLTAAVTVATLDIATGGNMARSLADTKVNNDAPFIEQGVGTVEQKTGEYATYIESTIKELFSDDLPTDDNSSER